jgi:hypothetical protein
MTVFLSFASPDKALAHEMVRLLRIGTGLRHDEFFCTVMPEMIDNGKPFTDAIFAKLNQATLIVSMLSHDYVKSQYCLAELGAALARQEAGAARFGCSCTARSTCRLAGFLPPPSPPKTAETKK